MENLNNTFMAAELLFKSDQKVLTLSRAYLFLSSSFSSVEVEIETVMVESPCDPLSSKQCSMDDKTKTVIFTI